MNSDEVAILARAITDKSERETPRPQMLPGTVVRVDTAVVGAMPTADVRFESNGPTISVTVIAASVVVDQIVMVMFIEGQAVTWGGAAIATAPPIDGGE